MKRGFTLIECLVCMAIIAVLAAISYPVIGIVKQQSKIAGAESNLHQLYLAMSLYRSAYDGDGVYGEAASMGLPTDEGFPSPYNIFAKPRRNLLNSPCGLNRSWYGPEGNPPLENIIYRAADARTFGAYASKFRQNALLFKDVNCDDVDTPYNNRYLPHRGVGVLVEGQLVRHYKSGSMDTDQWWSEPPGGN